MQCSRGRAGWLAAFLAAASASAWAQGDGVVLKNATIYTTPFDPPIANGVIVIRGGKIVDAGARRAVRIPAGVEAIDCSGLTVTAGFWNSHVHFMERKWAGADALRSQELAAELEAMLTRYGFTSVFDLSSPLANTGHIRRRVEAREVPGPRIRTTGEALIGKGWLPPDLVLRVLGNMVFPLHEITEAGGARAAARKNLDTGADGIKLFTGAQAPSAATLPEEAIRAAVEEAHRGGKPVFAHPSTREGLLAAARGGVDVVAHTVPPSGVWDEALVQPMIQAGVALIPTLRIWTFQLRHDRLSAEEAMAATVTGQLRAWVAAGGSVLFGTDAGGMEEYDPGREYELMARAGMTFPRILASLTTTPAAKFGDGTRLGKIAPGYLADLVVLRGDPARDRRALTAVQCVFRDGRIVYRAP